MRASRRDPSRSPALFSLLAPGLAALPLLAGATPAVAQDCGFGDLDPTFAITEVVGGDSMNGVDVLPDGRAYAALQIDSPTVEAHFTVSRTLADGTLDPSFAAGGVLSLDLLGSDDSWANDVEVTADGGAVAVGAAWDAFGTDEILGVLLRVTADGQLDSSFGTDGMVLVPGGGYCELNEVEVLADGRIVVAGLVIPGSPGPDLTIMRFHPDGSPDASYGTAGAVLHDVVASPDYDEIAIGADGSVAVASPAFSTVSLFDSNGQLDPSFGVGGRVEITQSSFYLIKTLAIDADGGVVVGGLHLIPSNAELMALRLLADGSLDTSWGSGGTWIGPEAYEPWEFDGIAADGEGGHYLVVSLMTPSVRTALVHMLPGGAPAGEPAIAASSPKLRVSPGGISRAACS